jgi:hypothetical protein
VSTEGSAQDLEPQPPEHRFRKSLIAFGIAFVVGAIVALVANALISGPSIEVVEASFEGATADLDAIAVEGEDGEYDLTHAAGVECLPEMEPGDTVRLGLANIDRGDADIPFVAELHQDRVVLWVECLPGDRAEL